MISENNKPCQLTQQQLHFFSIPSGRGNTLLDYDLTPRFLHDRAQKRIAIDANAEYLPRCIQLNEHEKYEIEPAIVNVKDPDGCLNEQGIVRSRRYAVYPGTRESLIEDCLIYFARHGEFSVDKGEPGYRYDSGTIGVCFTLHQLRVALKGQGKEYRLDELREGLEVLAKAKYRFSDDDDRERTGGYIVSELSSMPNPHVNDRIRSDRIVYVLFDPRVSSRILGGHYRTYDDKCALSMKSPIARYLYKQFTHHWQHANNNNESGSVRSVDQNETILASGCPLSTNVTKRKTNMLKALSELCQSGIIQAIDESSDVVPIKAGRKVVDVRFMVRPTNAFIKQQIEGYKRLQRTRKVGLEMTEQKQLKQIQ